MPCTVGDGAFSIVYAKTLPGSTTILRITPNVGVIITRVIMAANYITANVGGCPVGFSGPVICPKRPPRCFYMILPIPGPSASRTISRATISRACSAAGVYGVASICRMDITSFE